MKVLAQKKALALRKQGKSIKTIARELEVSSGSVSRWCRGVALTLEQRKRLDAAQRVAAARALAPLILERKNAKSKDFARQEQDARKDVRTISKRDLFILGLGLYWGEGYKRGSDEWGFTNSDSAIIRTILSWLSICYGITTDRLIARLTINTLHRHRADSITKEWSRETGIPLKQFGPPSFIHGYGKSKLDQRTYRGTLRVKVRSGTSLRRRILASIAIAEKDIATNLKRRA